MQTKMDFFHTVSLLLGGEELLLRLEKIQSSKDINDYTQIKCTLLTLILLLISVKCIAFCRKYKFYFKSFAAKKIDF